MTLVMCIQYLAVELEGFTIKWFIVEGFTVQNFNCTKRKSQYGVVSLLFIVDL